MKIEIIHSSDFITKFKKHWYRRKEGELIILNRYENVYGRRPNLQEPRLFSEKLYKQMIAMNRRVPAIMTKLSDKLRVRDYIRSKIGVEVLVPLLWHGPNPSEIPFDSLPAKYIIKVNHGSGGNIIVNGAPERAAIIERLSGWLGTNYYWDDREAQYLHIKPKIVIEEFLEDNQGRGPLDYRFWCFNGRPELIQVDNVRHSINPFYDTKWTKLDLSYRKQFEDFDADRPSQLNEMLKMASILAKDFEFVRVDLYCLAKRVYFGEMTFTPVAGRLRFSPDTWDERLGSMWRMNS